MFCSSRMKMSASSLPSRSVADLPAAVPCTNRTLTFAGKQSVTAAAGQRVSSDAVKLSWVRGDDDEDSAGRAVEGRNLAISMYIPGQSGPMTFHSTALQESFLGAPNSGDHSSDDSDAAYPYETPAWFFVDAVDVLAPADTRVLVGAGSSSVDGSITTPGNNDRFLNWMSRRLHAAYGQHVSVVNAGIGGDTAAIPGAGQTRPLREVLPERFDRDVLGASGITDVVFYAGTMTSATRSPRRRASIRCAAWCRSCTASGSTPSAAP